MAKKTTRKRTPAKQAAAKKVTAKRAPAKRAPAKKTVRKAAKRELIDTGSDKRFVRRAAKGQFKESDDVGTSLPADRRKKAKTKAKRGQGDKGDR